MPQPSKFTLSGLKEKAKILKLVTMGTKAEIIACLKEADPSGAWMENGNEENLQSKDSIHERKINIYRRKKELAERKFELARREIAMLHANRGADVTEPVHEADDNNDNATALCKRKQIRQQLRIW